MVVAAVVVVVELGKVVSFRWLNLVLRYSLTVSAEAVVVVKAAEAIEAVEMVETVGAVRMVVDSWVDIYSELHPAQVYHLIAAVDVTVPTAFDSDLVALQMNFVMVVALHSVLYSSAAYL